MASSMGVNGEADGEGSASRGWLIGGGSGSGVDGGHGLVLDANPQRPSRVGPSTVKSVLAARNPQPAPITH